MVTKFIPPESKLLTPDKGYILGVLCGDGYLSTGFRIGLNVCDKDFAMEFNRCINSVYHFNLNIYEYESIVRGPNSLYYGIGKNRYSAVLCSKNAFYDLLTYDSSEFKTHTWDVPPQIFTTENLSITAAFIRGFFDSEGSIDLRSKGHARLQAYSFNEQALISVKKLLLEHFNIKMTLRKLDEKCFVIYTERYCYIKRFAETISFTIARKQTILQSSLLTYKRKGLKNYSPRFKQVLIALYKAGVSPRALGRMFHFPYTNIYDFLKQEKNAFGRI